MKSHKSRVVYFGVVVISILMIVSTVVLADDKIEPVDYNELKDMLPKKIGGYKKIDDYGGRKAMFGIRISQADATYENRKGDEIKISIIDFGSIKGIAGKAMLTWMSAEINNKSDDGYEKTTEYKGFKAFEKYSYEDKDGKLSVIVAERFLVDADGAGAEMKEIKKGVGDINLKKLSRMK